MDNGGLQDTSPPEIPGFSVGRKLGSGGSADVWLVQASGSHRRFALKCFRAPLSEAEAEEAVGAAEEADMRREVRLLSVLDHQHLVKAHDVIRLAGGDGRRLGVLLDFAAGGSLAQLVAARGRLTVGETVTVLTPVAQALAYLHANGFTHADVSPGNVLFSAEGKPLLSDLGMARMVGDPAAVARGGTSGFSDPAPVDGIRMGLQPERDLYSLAAVGWFCLTGDVPPATRERAPLPLIHPDVPGALAAVLESGLDEERRQRPTAAEFATAVYRSAAPAAVALSTSVHPSVIPELLTRRRLPDPAQDGLRSLLTTWRRRLTTPGTAGKRDHGRIQSGFSRFNRQPAGDGTLRSRKLPSRVAAGGMVALVVAVLATAAVLSTPPGFAPQEAVYARPSPAGSPEAAGGSGAVPASKEAAQEDGRGDGSRIPAEVEVQLGSSDPVLAVLGLAWLRSEAFREGKPELLDQVNVAGSSAHIADARIMAGLRASGRVLGDFSMVLGAINIAPGGTDNRTVVGMDSSTTSYVEAKTTGERLVERPAAPPERLRVVLERDEGRWRISGILPG